MYRGIREFPLGTAHKDDVALVLNEHCIFSLHRATFGH